MPDRVRRRDLLGMAGAVAGAALLSACTPDPVEPPELTGCVPRRSLTRYRALAGRPLVYEITSERTAFWLEPGFARQLETWLTELADQTSLRPDQVWTYGTWTDGGARCSSWHNTGRAFDLSRLRMPGGEFISCRYDRWRRSSAVDQRRSARRYWALAAGLHLHFAHVLTYLYDAQHHNHIHIDNGRSGSQRSTFRPRSRTQVQAVQAICTHLWDTPTEITGRWDRATRRATQDILSEMGATADLDSSVGWSTFLAASGTKILD